MIKKQYILIGSILLAAAILLTLYFTVLKPDEIPVETDPFFTLTEETNSALSGLSGNVEIIVLQTESKMNADENKAILLKFLKLYEENEKITLSYGNAKDYNSETADAVVFKSSSDSVTVNFEDLYQTNMFGYKYSFDGELLFSNAIMKCDGKNDVVYEKRTIRPLPGFDLLGDNINSDGRPFLYPQTNRSEVRSLRVSNQNGDYEMYKKDGTVDTFILKGAELASFIDETFISMFVNCTFVICSSRIDEPLSDDNYGLDEENITATVTVIKNDGKVHKFIIGAKTPSGSGYYCKYDGKPFIYVLNPDIEGSVLGKIESMLKVQLAYTIGNQNALTYIDNIIYRKYNGTEPEVDVVGFLMSKMKLSENAKSANDTQTVTGTLLDKKTFSGSYSGWSDNLSFFGFKKSSGDDLYIDVELYNHALDGHYSVQFGIVNDPSNNAVLPEEIIVLYKVEDQFIESSAKLIPAQTAGSYKQYTLVFEADKPVKWVRLLFKNLPNDKYIVLDEITPFADDIDALPEDTLSSIWKLVSPQSFLREGKNYAMPHTTYFYDFVNGIATLAGDVVVDYNADENMLKKYGLSEPKYMMSYSVLDTTSKVTYTSYLRFSEKNENGNYYCFGTISYADSNGENITISTGLIAEVTVETAPWLEYDALFFLENSIVSMYIDKIDNMTFEFGSAEYSFDLHRNDEGKMDAVTYGSDDIIVADFRRMYISILNCTITGEHDPADSNPVEILKLKIKSVTRTDEIVFYQISSSRAYYTINGEGKYYLLLNGLQTVMRNVGYLIEGTAVPR